MIDISAGRRRAPAVLVIVRHGESMGNIADRTARERGAGRLDLDTRDADTPLSDGGVQQARAVGRWVARLSAQERPGIVLSSPYLRALQTAQSTLGEVGTAGQVVVDERIRERDLGILDRLTGAGIRELLPEEAARRDHVGKFYYRPPGGESWTDVVLRVRSILADIRAEFDGQRVWVFTHQAVIMAFRYVLESLDEDTLLAIDRDIPLGNCSVTTYERGEDGSLRLLSFADTSAVEAGQAPATAEPPQARPDDD